MVYWSKLSGLQTHVGKSSNYRGKRPWYDDLTSGLYAKSVTSKPSEPSYLWLISNLENGIEDADKYKTDEVAHESYVKPTVNRHESVDIHVRKEEWRDR